MSNKRQFLAKVNNLENTVTLLKNSLNGSQPGSSFEPNTNRSEASRKNICSFESQLFNNLSMQNQMNFQNYMNIQSQLAILNTQTQISLAHTQLQSLYGQREHRNINDIAWLVIKDLYQDISSKIKWIRGLSDSFPIKQCVRQGGILSTHLYKIFIDELLDVLKSKRLGLRVGTVYIGSLACADDVALLASSVEELQLMF